MDEIEINEYVRTEKGYIFYIDNKKKIQALNFLDAQHGKIIRHSENIIDLIEKRGLC